jgi:hypothetical protein
MRRPWPGLGSRATGKKKILEGTFPEAVNQNPYIEVNGHITTREISRPPPSAPSSKKEPPVWTVYKVGWDQDPFWAIFTVPECTVRFNIRTYVF